MALFFNTILLSFLNREVFFQNNCSDVAVILQVTVGLFNGPLLKRNCTSCYKA